MKKQTLLLLLLVVMVIAILFPSCSQTQSGKMQDGYYTAEFASFDAHGWKEFITIYVNNNKIVTVDYNAKNASGFIKSWDMDYMRTMNATDGTYPNKYTRAYAVALLNKQNPEGVDVISGATHSYTSFQLLAEAAISQAKVGDKSVAFIKLPETE